MTRNPHTRVRAGLCALHAFLLLSLPAMAATVDFDDLPEGDILNSGDFYQGVQFFFDNQGGGPSIGGIYDSDTNNGDDPDLERFPVVLSTSGPGWMGTGQLNPNGWTGGNMSTLDPMPRFGGEAGRLLIIQENTTDANNDGILDDPDDEAGGGIIRMDLPTLSLAFQLMFVDFEASEADALSFYRDGMLVATVDFESFIDPTAGNPFYDASVTAGDHHANLLPEITASQLAGMDMTGGNGEFDRVDVIFDASGSLGLFTYTPVPEPASLALIALGGVLLRRRRPSA